MGIVHVFRPDRAQIAKVRRICQAKSQQCGRREPIIDLCLSLDPRLPAGLESGFDIVRPIFVAITFVLIVECSLGFGGL